MGIFDFVGDVVDTLAGAKQADKANDFAREQFKYQRDAARSQVQWRVEDAKKAGIHPLAALGIMPTSFSPTMMEGGGGTNFGGMGQNIDRALGAYMDGPRRRKLEQLEAEETIRTRKREDVLFDQQVRANEIDIAVGASQLARLKAPGTAAPLDAAPGSVDVVPDRVVVGSPGEPARAPGMVTDYQFAPTASGGFSIIPSQDMKNRIEDMPTEWQWFLRNGISPPRGVYDSLQRLHPAPRGMRWQFNATRGEFTLERRDSALGNLYRFWFRPDLHERN